MEKFVWEGLTAWATAFRQKSNFAHPTKSIHSILRSTFVFEPLGGGDYFFGWFGNFGRNLE
jgi:hypothetical protein